MTEETWQVVFDTSFYVDSRWVPPVLAHNPWFWIGRRLGLRIASLYYSALDRLRGFLDE